MRFLLRLASLLLLAAGASQAQSPGTAYDKSTMRIARQSAQTALAEFASLVTEQNVKSLGFDALGQVRDAALGEPIAEFMVRLDELRSFAGGTDPASLLHPTGRVTYPLIAGGTTRSGVTIARRGGGWTAEGFGGATYVRHLTEIRDQAARASGRSVGDYFEARVPALNMTFVGFGDGTDLRLIPILSDPRYGLVKGEARSARDVFQVLAAAAREHNDLPGGR